MGELFGVKEVADITLYDLDTMKPALFLNSLKLTNLENNADTSYATGGQGNGRLMSWDFNRTANFTVQNALLNPKAVSMQLGTQVEKKIRTLFKREVLVAVAGSTGTKSKIVLNETPQATGMTIYKTTDGIEHGTEVTTGTVTAKEVEFAIADLPIGDKVIAYYKFDSQATAETITIASDKFSGYYMLVGDTLWRNPKGKDEKVQIIMSKVRISSQFNIEMKAEGDPSVFDFNMECFKADDSTTMVELVRY